MIHAFAGAREFERLGALGGRLQSLALLLSRPAYGSRVPRREQECLRLPGNYKHRSSGLARLKVKIIGARRRSATERPFRCSPGVAVEPQRMKVNCRVTL